MGAASSRQGWCRPRGVHPGLCCLAQAGKGLELCLGPQDPCHHRAGAKQVQHRGINQVPPVIQDPQKPRFRKSPHRQNSRPVHPSSAGPGLLRPQHIVLSLRGSDLAPVSTRDVGATRSPAQSWGGCCSQLRWPRSDHTHPRLSHPASSLVGAGPRCRALTRPHPRITAGASSGNRKLVSGPPASAR